MVECGGLENRFARNPGNEGSNPSSSARNAFRPDAPSGLIFYGGGHRGAADASWDRAAEPPGGADRCPIVYTSAMRMSNQLH